MDLHNPPKYDLIVCGQLCRDILSAQGRHVVRLGGVAYAASVGVRIAPHIGIIAPLTDPDGEAILSELEQRGIDCQGVQFSPSQPITYDIADADEVVAQKTLRSGPPSQLLPFPTIFPGIYRAARCALIYPVSIPFAVNIARELHADGTTIAIDLQHDVRSDEEIKDLSCIADYIFVNEGTLQDITGTKSIDASIDLFRAKTQSTIIVKMGLAGSLIYAGSNEPIEVPAFLSNFHFTVGAGDAYDAAFLLAMTRGMDLFKAGQAAALAAADVVESLDRDPSQQFSGISDRIKRQPVFLHPLSARTYRVYISGACASTSVPQELDRTIEAIEHLGISVFVPCREASIEREQDSTRVNTFESRIASLQACQVLVAVLDGANSHLALVEIGIAIERGLAVIILHLDEGTRLPDVAIQACDAIVGDLPSMINALMQRLAEYPQAS